MLNSSRQQHRWQKKHLYIPATRLIFYTFISNTFFSFFFFLFLSFFFFFFFVILFFVVHHHMTSFIWEINLTSEISNLFLRSEMLTLVALFTLSLPVEQLSRINFSIIILEYFFSRLYLAIPYQLFLVYIYIYIYIYIHVMNGVLRPIFNSETRSCSLQEPCSWTVEEVYLIPEPNLAVTSIQIFLAYI